MFVIYDGSFAGLLTAVAWCLRRRCRPDAILSESDQLPLLDSVTLPAEAGIRQLFGRHYRLQMGAEQAELVLDTAYRAWLSELPGLGTAIHGFLAAALHERKDPSGRLTDPDVAAVAGAARRVSGQAHQYLGLLRFRRVGPLLYLADFSPDYHVLPLILPHFADRLADQDFVICDRRRGIAAWHHAAGLDAVGYQPARQHPAIQRCTLHWLSDDDQQDASSALPGLPAGTAIPLQPLISGRCLSETAAGGPPHNADFQQTAIAAAGGDDYEAMWREYLNRLTIPERRNLFLQRGNLPKKYRKFMTEFNHSQAP